MYQRVEAFGSLMEKLQSKMMQVKAMMQWKAQTKVTKIVARLVDIYEL